jgi:hypothetical protein
MRVETWTKGSVPELDFLFDQLREQQYQDRSHRLWQNYSKTSFEHAGIIACTIYFDDDDLPEMCSSIASRDCWPVNAYRILNRLWKHSNKIKFPRVMSPSFAESAKSQIAWLAQNTNCELYFISRQTDNWEEWVIKNFQEVYGVSFKTDNYKYLTCPNECDDTCWQKIIYNGNEQLLTQWKQKTL